MKKITLVFLFAAFLFAGNVFSQTAPLAKGQKQLNFGVFPEGYGLPLYLDLDIAIHEDVTIAPGFYFDLENNDNYYYDNNNDHFGIYIKGDYHFNRLFSIPSEFDLYAGATLKYRFFENKNYNRLGHGFQVGARWYWSSKWGLNLELGGGSVYGARFGLSLKF